MRIHAIYCSSRCIDTARMERHRARVAAIPCGYCGTGFKPDKPSSRFCCLKCASLALRRRDTIACAHCGFSFYQRSWTARYCSASCVAKAKHASGVLRHFRRKLTACRFDRMIERQRPSRPYRRRLTAERFDRLVAG